MCVCFPVVRRDIFQELHLTETWTQSTKLPVVRFVCVPWQIHFVTPVGEGTVKCVTPVLDEDQLNDTGTVGEGKERRGDTVLTEKD